MEDLCGCEESTNYCAALQEVRQYLVSQDINGINAEMIKNIDKTLQARKKLNGDKSTIKSNDNPLKWEDLHTGMKVKSIYSEVYDLNDIEMTLTLCNCYGLPLQKPTKTRCGWHIEELPHRAINYSNIYNKKIILVQIKDKSTVGGKLVYFE